MQADLQMHSSPPIPATAAQIVAVAVLYKQSIFESASVASLLRILDGHADWRQQFSLVLYDNSPEPQALPADLPLTPTYIHDGGNGGLAPAYQYALDQATAVGASWLLLLDQDTRLTEEFVAECLQRFADLDGSPEIGGIVPKLVANGIIYSPESDFLYRLRRQFRKERHPVEAMAVGVQPKPLSAYNSGALLRVDALQKIGGFPKAFWLDYLDHAVFQEMQHHGFRLFVMEAVLEQNLSHLDLDSVPHWRHRNVLTAQTQFVRRYGNWKDRIWFRIYLLRTALFLFVTRRNRWLWKEMLLQAVVLRIPSVQLGE
jgi:GT2 family glycosyltransferase